MYEKRALGRWSSVFAVLGAVACGSKGAERPADAPARASAEPARETAAVVPLERTRVDSDASLLIYLDAAGFRASPPFRALESVLAFIPGAAGERARLSQQCGFDLLQSLEGLAVSGDSGPGGLDTGSAIVAARFAVPPERVLDCITRLVPGASATEIEGRRAVSAPGIVCVSDGGLLLAGEPQRMTLALAQPPTLPRAIGTETYLHVRTSAARPFGIDELTFGMSRLPDGTRLRIVGENASPAAAARTEDLFRQLRDVAKERIARSLESPEARVYLAKLLDGTAIETRGTAVSATLDLPGAEAEAAFTGVISAIAVYGVKRYIAQAKTEEARRSVSLIAKSLALYAEEKHRRRFPKSAPRTPKEVPAGTKFQSDVTSWSHPSWKAIAFQLEQPQYYAYEFETAPDGRRATVRAQGDLDGDGVTSRFELDVAVAADGKIQIGPELRETEPLE